MPLRRISADEFARRLKVTSQEADKRFAFFLGAGCSVSSGISAAGNLVKNDWLPRLRDVCAPHCQDLEAWAKEKFADYDPENLSALYGPVMEGLFFSPEERQREIERLCDGRFPGFGYAAMASLVALEGGRFNVVLTTNFDDLIADALYLFTQARPLVIHHESLASYIRPTRTRPLVVKLHGDHRLSPQNTAQETEALKEEIEKHVRTLLHDRGLIFVGYGGNDQGIKKMLEALPTEALPLGVFWIARKEPESAMRPWLESRNAIWVEKGDFDELMLLVRDVFDLPHPNRKRFDEVFERYKNKYGEFSGRIVSLPDTAPGAKVLKEAVKRTDESLPALWRVLMTAERLTKTNPDEAQVIYEKALEAFPDSVSLLVDYAIFLTEIRKDYDRAEECYRRALSINSSDFRTLANYAVFLRNIRRGYEQAEKYYRRALLAEPDHAYNLCNYAGFLLSRGQTQEGLSLLEQALLSPDILIDPALAAECWFYAFAHRPLEGRAQALRNLKSALQRGSRLPPSWNLSPNVERAEQDGHPSIPWLKKLVAVITGGADIKTLDSWPDWKKA